MNDNYVANIGDYSKLALLRTLMPGRRLGVAWYLTPPEERPTAGNRWDYLCRPNEWAALDEDLFNALHDLRLSNHPHVSDLEPLLQGATFSSLPIPTPQLGTRATWFEQTQNDLGNCDLIFLDPDIGLAREKIAAHHKQADRYALIEEVEAMQEGGRTIVLYHHQPRVETETECHWIGQTLRKSGVRVTAIIRIAAWSPRFYILVNADPDSRERARAYAKRWRQTASWFNCEWP